MAGQSTPEAAPIQPPQRRTDVPLPAASRPARRFTEASPGRAGRLLTKGQ